MYNENQPFSFGVENENTAFDANKIGISDNIFNYASNASESTDLSNSINNHFSIGNFEQKLGDTSIFDTEVSSSEITNPTLESKNEDFENVGEDNNIESDISSETPDNFDDTISTPRLDNPVEPVVLSDSLEKGYETSSDVNSAIELSKPKEEDSIDDSSEITPISEDSISKLPENGDVEEEEKTQIEMSETPIEEIQKLTEYEPDNIESTDINSLFDRVSINFKDASDIFKRNTEMKQKIDSRFSELKALQNELNSQKQNQMNEINEYKDEVYSKLTDKKDEIEKRLNLLKEMQSNFEKEKEAFEKYKKDEMDNIEKIKREVQEAYDDRREELNNVETLLRKQKDELDEERNQLSLDKIEYESNKNELANNLLKFNELVDSFTNGVGNIEGDK